MSMKIELSFLAALILSATRMVFRMQIYGVEQALLSTTLEYGMKAARRARTLLPRSVDLCNKSGRNADSAAAFRFRSPLV